MDIIRTAYYIHGRELMKLIFAVYTSHKRWALHVVIKSMALFLHFIGVAVAFDRDYLESRCGHLQKEISSKTFRQLRPKW